MCVLLFFRSYSIPTLFFLLSAGVSAAATTAKTKEVDQQIAQLQNELIESEIATAQALAQVQDIEKQVSEENINLRQLKKQKMRYSKALSTEQKHLKKQLRSAYKLGHNTTAILLLNAGDPVRMQRMLRYSDYYNRAYVNRVKRIDDKLQAIIKLQRSIEHANETLKVLQSKYQKRVEYYASAKGHRKQLVGHLQHYIRQQQRNLQVLQRGDRELQTLLGRLSKKEAATTKTLPNMPSFDNLKGKLKWPLNGRFIQKFGDLKKEVNLQSKGVIIKARQGTDVQAISAGDVIFADWFGNLGLLLIIDHDHGYMSLYGHNQILFKKAGSKVSAREVIAQAGSTGGHSQTGLYFEIRKDSVPVNPATWCLP